MLASIDSHAFAARASRKLLREPQGLIGPQSNPKGDHELAFDGTPWTPPSLPTPAAVLVPVVLHDAEATVLLTQRASNMRAHSGQIAFPGGRIDEQDETPLVTALREAEEEIGLERLHVSPIGYLDAYLSSSGYLVTPVVAVVEPRFTLSLNPSEVADAFEVPLAFLMDPANHRKGSRVWQGAARTFFEMPYGDRHIWGITAGILRVLYERLYVDPVGATG